MGKNVLVSGIRPTGYLHLGHYFGVIRKWLELQESKQFDSQRYFFIANWHALTTKYHEPLEIRKHTETLMRELLACGIDSNKTTLFIQSEVKEIAELYLLFGMITPKSWLELNPTYKDLKQNLHNREHIDTYGFFGYPVLQAADILILQGTHVLVGKDQLPHIELTREIARRFNKLYGTTLPEPQVILTEASKIVSIDGRKMSKSYNNAIFLTDSPEVIQQKVRLMVTDPNRIRKTDPGDPKICSVFQLHKLISPMSEVGEIEKACRQGEIGCVECKYRLASNINSLIIPIRDKLKLLEKTDVKEIFIEGSSKAREKARETIEEIREKMRLI